MTTITETRPILEVAKRLETTQTLASVLSAELYDLLKTTTNLQRAYIQRHDIEELIGKLSSKRELLLVVLSNLEATERLAVQTLKEEAVEAVI